MAIWTQQPKIVLATVIRIAINVIDFKRNLASGWVNLRPTTLTAFTSLLFKKIKPNAATKNFGFTTNTLSSGKPTRQTLSAFEKTLTLVATVCAASNLFLAVSASHTIDKVAGSPGIEPGKRT